MDNGNDGTAMGRYWSEDADNYDGIVRAELRSFRASAWSAFFERRLNPASRVLDFGCGPGFFTVLLARLGHDVTAVDISSRMARAAGRNAAKFAREALDEGRIAIHHVETGLRGFEAGTFDAVVMRNVTWTMKEPAKFYGDCRRVLAPGGRLLVFDANWNLPLFDEALAARCAERERLCIERFGSTFDGPRIEEPLDCRALPLSRRVRPAWDVRTLNMLGFAGVEAEHDLTDRFWDEKERLLYGETPLFCVTGERPAAGGCRL